MCGTMKRGTLATALGLAGLLAAPAGAQVMPPGAMPQPLGVDPRAVPPSVPESGAQPPDDPNASDPNAYDPNAYDPNVSDPNAANVNQAVPNLGPDNDIAQTYDDGYDPQAYTQFQDALAPYGTWSSDDSYGEVWTPASAIVGGDFLPYATAGHWVRSEYGWTWVSDWNWGWAPFHYGRWIVRDARWSWVPGTMWGPAWVAWRSGNGYVGWAPLPPRGVRLAAWTRSGSPWRFTAASNLGTSRLAFLAPRYMPQLFARTTVVSTDRLLTHGNWRVRVNAGPVRGVSGTIVPLSRIASAVLPRVAVYPHAGMPVYARPWVHNAEARRDPLTNGWRDGAPALSPHATYGRPAPSMARPSFMPRPMPAAGAPAYGRPAPSVAGHSSAGAPMSFTPHPGFQPPAARAPAPTTPRAAFQPPSAHASGPAPHAFSPPPSNFGAFHPPAGGAGFHPQTAGGGFHGPARGSYQPPAGGSFHEPAGGRFQGPAGGGFHGPAGGGVQGAAGGGFRGPPAGGAVHAPAGGAFQRPAGGGGPHFGGGGGHRR